MIGRISGILLEKNPPQLLVEAGGIGYELDVPMSTFYELPACGAKVTLHTHFVMREDGQFLYGFATLEERSTFRQLLKISGIGARMALAVLSGLSTGELARAVALQEVGRLVKIPGIGKKTAERLLLELRGKLDAPPAAVPAGKTSRPGTLASDARTDILNALLALGYNEREASGAMKALSGEEEVAAGIRLALRQLAQA
ncbi:MAG: Holliday junction branch migration protein RuvA [Azoarcus sp.]|jgi:Holliday junction DNA helicase RuvA|nr:Holliday junction branch migration protein RuvA [Azoarcus sp.]